MYALTVEYDGAKFAGYQWQPGLRTVGGVVQDALRRLFGEPIALSAAGRTDAGVHACAQVVSFSVAREMPLEKIAAALGGMLPRDVGVRAPAVMPEGFSARFSALERRYAYLILNRRERAPLLRDRVWHVWRPIDLVTMRQAARALVGEHDFRSFCGVPPPGGNTVRCVNALTIESRGDVLVLDVAANGFLHHMVRTIAGTLVECATGRRDPDLRAVLDARDRRAAGVNAPPQGLYLTGVRYANYQASGAPPLLRSVS